MVFDLDVASPNTMRDHFRVAQITRAPALRERTIRTARVDESSVRSFMREQWHARCSA
jgi:hypothetical protein